MPSSLTLFVVYLVGVVIGLSVMRDSWPSRLGTALVWPLGPVAFLIVTPVLLLVAAVLWPIPILAAATMVGVLAWLLM